MRIGIDASRAFQKNRTGIEEYSYQVIKHLTDKLSGHEVILYVSTNYELNTNLRIANIEDDIQLELNLPENWKIKVIKFPYFWTQLGLSLEMLLHPVDVLFIPAHTVPLIHPACTVVTIHGLEYEFCPEAYSWWEKFYMRLVIKNSCRWAKKIIAVSENTKKDLINLYQVAEEKIEVIYEGYDCNFKFQISNFKSNPNEQILNSKIYTKYKILNTKYLLFIGRLEERKNIVGIIKAFEILKERYKIPHKLVLAGKFGYGREKIQEELKNINCAQDIILPGFVSEEEKWELLKSADVFLFPTFYEGFGIPILEAQSVGCPVVAGNNSSIKEIITMSFSPLLRRDVSQGQRGSEIDDGDLSPTLSLERRGSVMTAILTDPHNAEAIADAAYKLISDESLQDDIIKRGYENVKRFSWEKCAELITQALKEMNKDTKFNK